MLEDEYLEKIKCLKVRSAAYSDFVISGIDFVRKYYPEQVEFVLENKDKNEQEVQDTIQAEFEIVVANYHDLKKYV